MKMQLEAMSTISATMEDTALSERNPAALRIRETRELDYVLNVVLFYQDERTRRWAGEVYSRVAGLLGEECVTAIWLNMGLLNRPLTLAQAVSTTRCSDLVVVALRTADKLPPSLHLWADRWLSDGLHQSGALVALLGRPNRPSPETDHTRQYFTFLSRRGHLDLMVQERELDANRMPPLPA